MIILYVSLFVAVAIVNLVKFMVFKREIPFFILTDSKWRWPVLGITIAMFIAVFSGVHYKYLLFWLVFIEIADFAAYLVKNN
ncbi:MAG: hypothetical protein PHI41_07875 [Erysipelotrichaceae bacterium]|nr:hypothetical protein [Erysipelotrichaceae bacterium]MDD3809250.1 hypothetical protein [Erysipelotrichaceae bacterium]